MTQNYRKNIGCFLFDIGFEYYGFDYADLHEGEYGTGGKLTKNFTIDLNNLDRYIRSTQSRLENDYVETMNGQLFAEKSRKALSKMKEDYDYNWLKSQKTIIHQNAGATWLR